LPTCPGRRSLRAGDLVTLDVTVEKDGYLADTARTVVVGTGSPTAERLVQCAEAADHAALAVATAGVRVNEIGRAVECEVGDWGSR
jgi:methionyl aminopeptidase